MNSSGPLGDMHWREFRNDSGEEIPAFACMRITGAEVVSTGRVTLTVGKPNTFGAQYNHVFNGPLKVANGKYGLCTRSDGAAALYDSADGTPAFGESWGPRDATWKLKKNTGGFLIEIVTNSNDKIAAVKSCPWTSFQGKCDAAIAKNAKGTVSIYYRSSLTAYTDTTVNMDDVLNSSCAAASGDYVHCVWERDASQPYWKMI